MRLLRLLGLITDTGGTFNTEQALDGVSPEEFIHITSVIENH